MKTTTAKRYIKEGHSIKIFMWKNTNPLFEVHTWEDFKNGDSAMETGAGSLHAAMKIVKMHLGDGYTHFTLKYPCAMHGNMVKEPERGK